MLTLTLPAVDYFDEIAERFVTSEAVIVQLEHSLVSLSKWEEIWEKPFIDVVEKTTEETYSYMHCMCLTPGITPEDLQRLSRAQVVEINSYIDAKMSATWFNERDRPKGRSREKITAELIYFWMIGLNISKEFETWHLNKLFTLIKVANEKNTPPKKRGKRDMVAERNRINAERRAKMQTSG